jgi:hypothetical protein
VTSTFAEVARRVGLHSEWFGRGFETCEFHLGDFTLDEATALRSCWPPCDRFDSGLVTCDGDRRPISTHPVEQPLVLMICTKLVLDRFWPSKYVAHVIVGDELVAMDGNHRLAALAMRRAEGHLDRLEIRGYVCREAR